MVDIFLPATSGPEDNEENKDSLDTENKFKTGKFNKTQFLSDPPWQARKDFGFKSSFISPLPGGQG